jgi:hypothetical protein
MGYIHVGDVLINISRPKCIEMHYVTHRSLWMQKNKFGVMCPDTLFMETVSGLPEHEK